MATTSSVRDTKTGACRAGLCSPAGLAAGGEVRARHPEGSCRLLPWPGGLCGGFHGPFLPRAGQGPGARHQCDQVTPASGHMQRKPGLVMSFLCSRPCSVVCSLARPGVKAAVWCANKSKNKQAQKVRTGVCLLCRQKPARNLCAVLLGTGH